MVLNYSIGERVVVASKAGRPSSDFCTATALTGVVAAIMITGTAGDGNNTCTYFVDLDGMFQGAQLPVESGYLRRMPKRLDPRGVSEPRQGFAPRPMVLPHVN
jgi:hypothetical protein